MTDAVDVLFVTLDVAVAVYIDDAVVEVVGVRVEPVEVTFEDFLNMIVVDVVAGVDLVVAHTCRYFDATVVRSCFSGA